MLTSASDYLYDYTSNDQPATLDHGDKVRVDSGPHAGQVFEYVGATITGAHRPDAGSSRTTTTRRTWHNADAAAAGAPRLHERPDARDA